MTNQSDGGGYREGSGRAAATVTTRRITCTLDDDTLSKARELGGGNLGRGIRRAVAKTIKNKNRRRSEPSNGYSLRWPASDASCRFRLHPYV